MEGSEKCDNTIELEIRQVHDWRMGPSPRKWISYVRHDSSGTIIIHHWTKYMVFEYINTRYND